MPRITALKLIITICLGVIILANPSVIAKQSAEHFSVYTDKKEYVMGEAVNIYVITNVIEPHKTIKVTDVIVYDHENNPIAEWHHLSILLTDATASVLVGSVIAESEGEHTAHAKAIEFYDLNSDGTADAEDYVLSLLPTVHIQNIQDGINQLTSTETT